MGNKRNNDLEKGLERYKRLLESVTDYIYTVNVENGAPVETLHEPGCCNVTGFTPEEYDADPYLWYSMIHEDDRGAVIGQAAKLLAGMKVPSLEHRIVHKDGSIRWVRNTCVPRFNEKGEVVAYDGLIEDISERKRLEDELKQKLSDLERMNRLMVDRELRMEEMKKEIERLKGENGKDGRTRVEGR